MGISYGQKRMYNNEIIHVFGLVEGKNSGVSLLFSQERSCSLCVVSPWPWEIFR